MGRQIDVADSHAGFLHAVLDFRRLSDGLGMVEEIIGRLLHDRTADKIAGVVSRVPNAAATIIPFDVQNRVQVLHERQAIHDGRAPGSVTTPPGPPADGATPERQEVKDVQDVQAADPAATPAEGKAEPLPGAGTYDRPVPPPDVTPIGSLHQPGRAAVEGRVRVVE
ncbi:MAG: hypothetical protein ACLQVW_22440, partial [Limisphaerales bacterium]